MISLRSGILYAMAQSNHFRVELEVHMMLICTFVKVCFACKAQTQIIAKASLI